MKYRITRTVVAVQYAIVEADTEEEAAEEANYNPQLLQWETSSENDMVVTDIQKEG